MSIKSLSIILAFSVFLCITNVQAATIYVPDDYESIQEAIDNANNGDTIIVRDGIYYENVEIDKSVTLKSDNGYANCIIDAGGLGDVITINADGVVIDGFTIRNGNGSGWLVGIYVKSDYNLIKNNSIISNDCGIELYKSSNNKITNNRVEYNKGGIWLSYSSNNKIDSNNIISNNRSGIYLYKSSNNVITNNKVEYNNEDGIWLEDYSNNNIITNNRVENNNRCGILLLVSSNNIIYLNNFISNTYSVYSIFSSNIWNSTEKITYEYNGKTYNYLGNYWSDYEGEDKNNDGIGDEPYQIYWDEYHQIDSYKDNYPLIAPVEQFKIISTQ